MQKNAIIFGDSYSTFEKFIPEGNAIYYYDGGNKTTDVTKVEETWWHQVAKEINLNILLNDSWSGSTICYTGYDGVDCSKTSSFIYRLRKHIADGFFEKNKIDKIFVYGAINDNAVNAPLGEIKYDDFKEEDLYNVLPAIAYFVKTLKEVSPKADIYCLVNTEIKPEIVEGFEKICKTFGATAIVFEKIDKSNGHPTVQGMKDIKNKVLEYLK
ncbi:MAG: hypothetical protein E7537_00720 [Ruminococcaceae bacterium]|nr:hypothetical protein [Oscillospiraceae bacterium]